MAEVSTSHKFTSGKSDGSDATLVQPSNWNADHNFGAGTNGDLLLRDTGATDGASWLASAATGQVLISGGAGSAPSYSDSPALKALTVAVGATTSAATDLLINPATKASGNLLDLQVASASKFSVDYAGSAVASGSVSVRAGADSAPTLDVEKLTNAGFDSDLSGWTAGAGWSWSAGTALHTAGNTATLVQSSVTVSSGVLVVLALTVTGRTAGSCTVGMSGVTDTGTATLSTNTTHYLGFYTNATTVSVTITPTTDFDGAFDAVSLKILTAATGGTIAVKNGDTLSYYLTAGGAGLDNIHIGASAGHANIASSQNISLGNYTHQRLLSNLSSGNIAIGQEARRYATRGYSNVAIGFQAMTGAFAANYSVAVGAYALMATGLSGAFNVAVGHSAGTALTSGASTVAAGAYALGGVTTGSNNVGLGYQAGRYHADGSTSLTDPENSIYIGYAARGYNNSDSNSIVIGYVAIGAGANTAVIGNSSLTAAYFGSATPAATVHAKALSLAAGATTSAVTDLLVNPTVKASGNLIDAQVGGTSKFTVDYLGGVVAASHYAGAGTVAAAGDLRIQKSGTVAWYGTGASDDHTMVGGVKDLTDNSAIGLFEVALGANTQVGGQVFYTIVCSDGTDHQAHSGLVTFAAVNKGGVYTANIAETSEQQANSTGTLTDTFAISSGTNKITVTLNANSSLTPTKLRIYYKVLCNAPQAVTIL